MHKEKSTKIINGKSADYKKYPFFGILFVDGDASCGCSYIGGPFNAVITAAHCLIGEESGEYLTVGFLQPDILTPVFIYKVSKIIIHPLYPLNNIEDYDIAILYLEIKPNELIKPLRIPSRLQALEFVKPSRPVEVIGYGISCVNCNVQPKIDKNEKTAVDIIENGKATPEPSEVLLSGLINIVSKKPSKYNLYLPERITARMILAGKFNVYSNPNDNIDACQGDSGGPLLYNFKGEYQLVGIVCKGIGCGLTGYPSVYTYVNWFRNWIKKNTNLSYL
jgi:secreted trypsin-like serine protease